MIQTYSVQIKEHHLDSYGHVNNAVYLSLFEEARWQIITDKGYGYQKVHQELKGPVILDLQIKFIKELKLRETITITMEVLDYKTKVFHFKQQMLNFNSDVICEMTGTAGLFDLQNRKLIAPTEEWLKALSI